MTAYYNEIDPYAAQWLRNLIAAGHIADGEVDERSIIDVIPDELRGFTQCHFFAGIGVWSLALRRAGWPDNRPVWTGSAPCQPFSAAGKGNGFADERHLWPAFHHLIAECRPAAVFGEQVASAAVDAWIDLVHADLEAVGYAFGSVPFPSAGVGAPHIRDRNYWVAHASGERRGRRQGAAHGRLNDRSHAGRLQGNDGAFGHGQAGVVRLADVQGLGREGQHVRTGGGLPSVGIEDIGSTMRPGPTNGFWRDADWLGCTDGKWRPVEPGTFPLAHGAAARVGRGGADWRTPAGTQGFGHRAGRLKGYGNAINAEAARAWIETVMECMR